MCRVRLYSLRSRSINRPRACALGWLRHWQFYAIAACLAITACTATPTPVCPAVVEYTREEQLQASKDLDLLPDASPVHRFMGDYKQLRAKLRTCQ